MKSAALSRGHRRHFHEPPAGGACATESEIQMKKGHGRRPCPFFLFTFVLIASRAVEVPGSHAALLETGGRSRTGRDRSCRAFRRAPCRYERRGGRASLSFLMENPCDACCLVRRKNSLLMGVSPSRWIARHIPKGNSIVNHFTPASQLNNSPVVPVPPRCAPSILNLRWCRWRVRARHAVPLLKKLQMRTERCVFRIPSIVIEMR